MTRPTQEWLETCREIYERVDRVKQKIVVVTKLHGYMVHGKPTCASWLGNEHDTGIKPEKCKFLINLVNMKGDMPICGFCHESVQRAEYGGEHTGYYSEMLVPVPGCPIWDKAFVREQIGEEYPYV